MAPWRLLPEHDRIRRDHVVELLRTPNEIAGPIGDEFVTLMPDPNGNYEIESDFTAAERDPEDDSGDPSEHRQLLFLDTDALFRRKQR